MKFEAKNVTLIPFKVILVFYISVVSTYLQVKRVRKTTMASFESYMSDRNKMHAFFVHCRKDGSVENFCCFYLIEDFKKNPRKRMAEFLIDNYMKISDASKGNFNNTDEYFPYATELNFTKEGGALLDANNIQSSINEKRQKIAAIGKTFSDKVAIHGRLKAMKMKLSGGSKLDVNTFSDLQKTASIGLSDPHDRFEKSPNGQAEDGGKQLNKFREAITIAGWSPDKLGMWD